MSQEINIVGRANGVGKNTFVYQYRDEYKFDYLRADEIAVGIKSKENYTIELKAGKLFFNKFFPETILYGIPNMHHLFTTPFHLLLTPQIQEPA